MRQGTPSYLARLMRGHPVLAADLLSLHNRWLRLRRDTPLQAALLLSVLLAAVLLVLVTRHFSAALAAAFTWLATHQPWAAAITTLYGLLQVSQRRARVEQRHALSWLGPASPMLGTPWAALLWRTLWPLVLQLSGVLAVVLAIGSRQVGGEQAWLLMGWIAAGGAAGAVIGWWRGGRRSAPPRYEDSRYVSRVRSRNPQHLPSLGALSRLPLARAQAWFRPENARVFVLLVIATMPAGTSTQSGMCAVLVAFLAAYAGALARSVLQAGSEAASWLRGTPMRFLPFAWPIMRGALLHQLVVSIAVAALLLPLGATLSGVVYLVVLWLALVFMSWCAWLQGCFVGQRPWLKVVSSVAATLGAEQLARGVGIVSAVLWTCWQLRRRTA